MSDKRKEEISAMMDNEASELELHRMLKSIEQEEELGESWSRYHLISGAMKGEIDSFSEFDISARVSAALEDEEVYSMSDADEPMAQSSAIENQSESSHSISKQSQAANGSWIKKIWQPVAQAAVAASVAIAVVTGWQGVQVAGQSAAEQPGHLVANQPASAPSQLISSAPIPSSNSGVQLVSQENRNNVLRSGGLNNGYGNIGSAYGNAAVSTSGLTTVSVPVSVRSNNNGIRNISPAGGPLTEQHRRMLDSYFVTHTGNASINSSQGMMPFARVVNIEVE